MNLRRHASAIVLISLVLGFGSIEAQEVSQAEILRALRECADHASTTLLDPRGQSRCEYNLVDGTWSPYEPAWHTGQIINGLVETFKVTGDSVYLRQAKRAGDWWCGLLITDHPVLKGMVRAIHMEKNPNIVFATVSDGTPGLFNLYRVTGIKKYAEVPTSAGRWMLAHMYEPSARLFYDNVDPSTGIVNKTSSPFWPDKQHQTLEDVARPNNEGSLFKDMYEFTGDEQFRRVFIELCEGLVERQGPEGLWMQFTPNDKSTGSLHPRFNLWNAESLLEGYALTGDKRYLNAAKRTMQFYIRLQKKDGMIYYDNFIDGTTKETSPSGSTAAFAGLLWMRLAAYGVGEEFSVNIERALSCVVRNRFSTSHPDTNLRGGVINIKVRSRNGRLVMMQRDVGTAFGLRFLAACYQDRQEKRK